MLKSLERAHDPCKTDLREGPTRPIWHAGKERTLRALFWVALSSALLLSAFAADAPVSTVFTPRSSTFLKLLAVYASKAGEGWVIAAVGAVASLLLFLRRRFSASLSVFFVAATGLLTGAAATIIRSLLGRTRPTSHELQGFYGVWHDSHWIIGKYEFGAFPSGHAATVIGLATAAWLIDRRLGTLAALYALLVSWSRIALGCHHFSDVVAAGILGIYGAQLISARLGPSVYSLGQSLQSAWLARKQALGSSPEEG
jgi:membrane-associated phospholipid phosphatase